MNVLLLMALLPVISLAPSAVKIQWKSVQGASLGYRVERQREGGAWQEIGETPLTSFESTGLTPGALYHHRVCAIRNDGCSGWISIADARPPLRKEAEKAGRIIVSHTDAVPRQDVGTFLEMGGKLNLFFGSFTGTKDVSRSRIARVTSVDGGITWSAPQIVFEDPDVSLLHPALARMSNGEVALAYSKLWGGDQAVKIFRYSRDEGKTWSQEIPLSDGSAPYMTGASDRLYRLSSGRLVDLVHGKIKNTGGSRTSAGKSEAATFVFFSDDNGRRWRKANAEPLVVDENPFGDHVSEYGFWETGMVEYAPGKLLMIGRTATGWAYESRSNDFGASWSKLSRCPALRNPEAPIYLIMVPKSKDILLLYNPIVDLKDWHWVAHHPRRADQLRRRPDLAWISRTAWSSSGQWFCYPCARWVGNTLHIAYHHWIFEPNIRYIDAAYQQVSLAWIEGAR